MPTLVGWVGRVAVIALLVLGTSACGADRTATLKREVMETYANIVFASYTDAHTTAVTLQQQIEAFVAAPSPETLQAARDAWLAAREPYGQTEAFRFYGGPIDGDNGPEGLINSWPLDEVYIDYVEGAPNAGIINDTANIPDITPELLIGRNQADSEESVSTGYHAIEFLLWGQDLRPDGAGQRPYTDYVTGGTVPNPERRARYLVLTANLLVEHLAQLKDAWDPAIANNYRATFLAQPPDTAIQQILTGIGVLSKSELAGERIFTAYDNQDQEDEHSCFSDNTHRDIATNAQGIQNVYLGEYTRTDATTVSGTGLDDLMASVNAELNQRVLAQLSKSEQLITMIPAPFDQAIVLPQERPQVLEVVNALQDQGDSFAEVARALNITINTALPE